MPIRCRGLSRLLILELALLTALPWLTLDIHAAELRKSRCGLPGWVNRWKILRAQRGLKDMLVDYADISTFERN